MNDMQTRNMVIRSVDTDERTIEGIAAPYNETIDAGDFFERFEPGVFGDIDNVRLYSEHDHLDKRAPIGMVIEGKETDEGFAIKARISATDKGNEVYELIKDGVLKSFSVGFVPVEDRVEDDNTVVRTKAELREVSVVAFPAYTAAQILAVRNEDSSNTNNNERGILDSTQIMTENNNYATVADIDEIRNDIDRRIAVLGDTKTDATPQFRSAGEWVKALSTGSSTAATEVRAYTGATSADSHVGNDWKASLLTVVDRGRPVLNLFSRGPLGPSGNTVEYPKIDSITGDVASQAAEGDNLAYLEVVITTETAPVLTYGGYSQLTRQAIERSDVSYLDAVLRAQAASYAKVTNAKVLATMVAATPQTGTSFTLSSATAADFIGAVVDGVVKVDANGEGAQADFILVSTDVAQKAATILDTNGNQIFKNGIVGLPIVTVPGLAAKSFYVASNVAVTSWENAGAPLRLEDENIINLSKDFSLYGYMAVGVTNANGLVKATVA